MFNIQKTYKKCWVGFKPTVPYFLIKEESIKRVIK